MESTAESTAEARDTNVKISIDKSVALDDVYILYGNFPLSNTYWRRADFDFRTITTQDAVGKEIPLEQGDVLHGPNGLTADNVFTIKVAAKNFTRP